MKATSDLAVFVIEGHLVGSLPEFYAEVSRVLIPGSSWGHNLDAFNDILHGGFGTPPEGFILKWNSWESSRARLGERTFGTLLDIIRAHGPGGTEGRSNVHLELA